MEDGVFLQVLFPLSIKLIATIQHNVGNNTNKQTVKTTGSSIQPS